MRDEKEKIVLTPAEDSPWYKFMVETLRLDIYHEKPQGWHWFCAFKDLSGSDLKKIQEILPEHHPFKPLTPLQSFLRPELNDAVIWLKNELKITGNIKEINFSERGFKDVDFSFFVFPIKVSFAKAVFYESADFSNVLFFGDADLSNPNKLYTSVSTDKSADFTEAYFTKQAIFTNTRFSESVIFNDSVFNGGANFKGAVFDALALFLNITFKFFTDFTNAIFHKTTGFANTKFLSGVHFTNATFIHGVAFDKIKITSSTNFKKTRFKNRMPDFYNAELHSNIIWDRDIKLWPKIKNHKNDDIYKGQIEDNQNAYENLVSHMKKLDKYHDEHFFYRQEMRCRRSLASPLAKCFYWFYESLADYGYGIESALLGWFLHIFVGMILIAATTKNNLCSIPLSFANAHSFLFFNKGPVSGCYELFEGNLLFNIIWGFQTILGVILLFLLLLTLRIRFRLK